MWDDEWTGRLMMIAAVVVFCLGGIAWPPKEISLTAIVLCLVLLAWGAQLDNRFTPQRIERKRRALMAKNLGEAFGSKWPDAPDDLVEWVARLDDARLADLHAWLSTFGDRPSTDGIATTRMAPPAVKAALERLTDNQRMVLQTVLECA